MKTVIDWLPIEQLEEDVVVWVTDGSYLEKASYLLNDEGHRTWFDDAFEMELTWEPKWYAEFIPLPQTEQGGRDE